MKKIIIPIFRPIRSLLRDDRGQTTAEYILILAVVVMVAMKFREKFNSRLGGIMDQTFGKMDDALRDSP